MPFPHRSGRFDLISRNDQWIGLDVIRSGEVEHSIRNVFVERQGYVTKTVNLDTGIDVVRDVVGVISRWLVLELTAQCIRKSLLLVRQQVKSMRKVITHNNCWNANVWLVNDDVFNSASRIGRYDDLFFNEHFVILVRCLSKYVPHIVKRSLPHHRRGRRCTR